MQNKKNECITEIEELVEEIKTLCNKNTLSIKNLKKYNITNIETKIAETQQESSRFISINISDLRLLPLYKLDKIKNKYLNHIDKLLNQDLYLQQLSSKCSFLQENNCMIKEEQEDYNEILEKSDTLTTLMKFSNANISNEILQKGSDEEDIDQEKEFNEENDDLQKKSSMIERSEYESLLNEHMKAMETIKELKRKLVQKHEEENLNKYNNLKKTSFCQNQKENYKNLSTEPSKPQKQNNVKVPKHKKNNSQQYKPLENQINQPICSIPGTNNNQQLWNYVFRLQSHLLEEIDFYEHQKKNLIMEIESQNKQLKQLMKEKMQRDDLKGYSSMGHYMDILDPQEILEMMKGAKELKSSINMKKKMQELQRENCERMEKLLKEKREMEEENNMLKYELENTRNESFIFKQSHDNEKDKNERMVELEKEKVQIERNLLEIERNKLKSEKEELLRLRELAKLSENRGYFKK